MVSQSAHVREYEIIYVLKPGLDDKVAKEFMLKTKETVKNLGGKNIKVDCWGRRKLAWECNKHQRGIFVHHAYLGPNTLVPELERLLGIDESVLLRQTMLLNKEVDESTKAEKEDNLEIVIVREHKDAPRQGYGFDGGSRRDDRGSRENGGRY